VRDKRDEKMDILTSAVFAGSRQSRVNAPLAVETLLFPSFLPSVPSRLICSPLDLACALIALAGDDTRTKFAGE
jgi:hypothetical protein